MVWIPFYKKQACACGNKQVSCELLTQMLRWLRTVFTGQSVCGTDRNVEESPHCAHVCLLGGSEDGN